MSLTTTNISQSKSRLSFKNVNYFSLAKVATVVSLLALFDVASIRAQIENELLHDQNINSFADINSLMIAVSSNDVDGVKFFSKAGASLLNQKNIGGATALHIAARSGNLEIINILLENGADVNAMDNESYTPLMRAAIIGNSKIVEALLNKGAKAESLNLNGESAISQSALSDCVECVNLILSKSDLINKMDNDALRKQLVDSYVIAGNHENKEIQVALEKYLDAVNKIAPEKQMAKDGDNIGAVGQGVYVSTLNDGQKVKYVLTDPENNSGSGNSSGNGGAAVATAFFPVTTYGNSQAQATPVSSSGDKVIKKFKFVAGASGVATTPMASTTNNAPVSAVQTSIASDSKPVAEASPANISTTSTAAATDSVAANPSTASTANQDPQTPTYTNSETKIKSNKINYIFKKPAEMKSEAK